MIRANRITKQLNPSFDLFGLQMSESQHELIKTTSLFDTVPFHRFDDDAPLSTKRLKIVLKHAVFDLHREV